MRNRHCLQILNRYVFFLAVLTFTNQLFSKSTTWITAGAGNWNDGMNWSIGIPTNADSAIIDLSTAQVLIPSGYAAEALHLSMDNDADLTIGLNAELLVKNSPGNGIFCQGDIVNNGTIGVSGAGSVSIYVLGVASRMHNLGTIEIQDGVFSGLLTLNATIENDGYIEVIDVNAQGIEIVWSQAVFQNDGKIFLDQISGSGILNSGEFINNDSIIITRVANMSGIVSGIKLDSTNQGPTPHVGTFDNQGFISIDDSEIGIENEFSTQFTNEGEIYISNCSQDGLCHQARAIFLMPSPSTLILTQITGDPLVIDRVGIFDITMGAIIDIGN